MSRSFGSGIVMMSRMAIGRLFAEVGDAIKRGKGAVKCVLIPFALV
jgi:hypothetical protein